MILLKKINSAPIAVNSDMIEFIEETPDTVITLANGDKVVVQEPMTEIIDKVVAYRCLVSDAVQKASHQHMRRVMPVGRSRHLLRG
jgi:flagellar protein FlbD